MIKVISTEKCFDRYIIIIYYKPVSLLVPVSEPYTHSVFFLLTIIAGNILKQNIQG